MFELRIALRYLIPRRQSFSTALVSLMSVLVISLVVWLVLIFLSVTAGIEKNWLNKLTSLHAPIRITPTDIYTSSYYHQIDSFSVASHYTLKTIGEKAESTLTDPFAVDLDAELPAFLSKPTPLLDPVKIAYRELATLHLTFQDYEIGGALLRLHREGGGILSQMSYLLSTPERNPKFQSLVIESLPIPNGTQNLDLGPVRYTSGSAVDVLLPKNYRDNGVKMGDTGALSYVAPTATSSQEQKIPIRISGFYDPGLLSIGNKCIIVPTSVTRTIHAASQTFCPDGTPTNGIFVWFEDLSEVDKVKEKIARAFAEAGIAKYWKIDTFRDFEFSKDLLLQFQSDRTLFLLIATIILVVACCNVISLLVLLVNDKKKEIAILQSMGASFRSIALIFGLCGGSVGALSCLIGGSLALFTLKHLDFFVSCLSALQGHTVFNPAFFGQTLPNQLEPEALLFVLIVTPILSLVAGLIPALKASRIRPSSVLRSE